jgi:hypothetical protein
VRSPASAATVTVTDGVCPEWPVLSAGARTLATSGWLRSMAGRLGPEPRTVEVRTADGLVLAAHASVQREPRPGEFFDLHHVLVAPTADFPLTPESRARRAELAATAPGPAAWTPSAVVMLPGYECVPVGPAAEDAAALRLLAGGVRDWADDQGIPTVAFLYTRPEQRSLAAALAETGYTPVPLTYSWELALPGATLDDYLAALPRKRRKEVRREARLLETSGVDIREAAVDPVFDDLVRLRCQLVTKYRGRADPAWEARRLRVLVDEVAAGEPVVLLAEADGAPVGFALFAATSPDWLCLAVGTDYTDPRSRLTYFGTAYHRAAELGYARGARTLGYGQGAWQAKRSRGCTPTPLTGWVHTRTPALAAALAASAASTRLTPL